jgi:hypothetical protein
LDDFVPVSNSIVRSNLSKAIRLNFFESTATRLFPDVHAKPHATTVERVG